MELRELTEEQINDLKRQSCDYDDLNSDGSQEVLFESNMTEVDYDSPDLREVISVMCVIQWKNPYTTALGGWDITPLLHQRYLEDLAQPLNDRD